MTSYLTGRALMLCLEQQVLDLRGEHDRLLNNIEDLKTLLTQATDILEVIAETDDRALTVLREMYRMSDKYYM